MKNNKRRRDIKSKLIAAICMLMVSTIMMVSTTYAWFTLSTAPEVTGISTSVGANGSLEMALLPEDGLTSSITSAVGDSYAKTGDYKESNVTWGNLVNVSTGYGLDQITLMPSALNLNGSGNLTVNAENGKDDSVHLATPTYGADGRVAELKTNSIANGVNDNEKFQLSDTTIYGVRGIGTTSALTERQLAYRNWTSQAVGDQSSARALARNSLEANGSTIGSIAVAYATGTTVFGDTELNALQAIVTALDGEGGAIDTVGESLKGYVIATVASAATDNSVTADSDAAREELIVGYINTMATMDIEDIVADATFSALLSDDFDAMYDEYEGMRTAMADAQTAINAAKTGAGTNEAGEATYTWAQIRAVLLHIANPDTMNVNGFTAEQIKADKEAFANDYISRGTILVSVPTGSGIYADIADFAGDYQATIVLEEVNAAGVSLTNVKATMATKTTLSSTYLAAMKAAAAAGGEPVSVTTEDAYITDLYGYIIDLNFRTNASDSYLQLQSEAVDRIYSDNANADTMGGGATMSFNLGTQYTLDQLVGTKDDAGNVLTKGLVEAINIVFFDTTSGELYGVAHVDSNTVKQATTGDYAYTAELVMMNYTTQENATTGLNDFVFSGPKYYMTTQTTTDDDGNIVETQVPQTNDDGSYKKDNRITALTAGEVKQVSVLVYLDGNLVDNSMVGTNDFSLNGALNLQFSSTATLTPMEYSGLYTPAAEAAP